MDEEWRAYDIDGWYEVSNLGRVRSFHMIGRSTGKRRATPRVLRPRLAGRKRCDLAICMRLEPNTSTYVYIARAVAETFLGLPPSDEHQAFHIDGDPSNNRVGNLEWVTADEMRERQRQRGTLAIGSGNGAATLSDVDVRAIRASYRQDSSRGRQRALAREYGVSFQTINNIVRRASWTHVQD